MLTCEARQESISIWDLVSTKDPARATALSDSFIRMRNC